MNKPHGTIRAGTFFLTMLLCMGAIHAHAQSSCTEFWLSFGEHRLRALDTGHFGNCTFGTELFFEIQINSMHQANGHIIFTHSNETVPFHVSPGHTFSYRPTYKQAKGCYHKTMDKRDNLSVCIQSDSSISVSAISRKNYDADATLVLPVEAVGCDYCIFRQNGNTTPQQDELCVIIATENNTVVKIGGQLLCTLDKGETYYFSISHSASGIQREIRSSKPVALFNVEKLTNIPLFGITDKLYEQYHPKSTGGKEFFIPASDMGSDFVQIMATENNTNITLSGGRLRTDISGPGKLNGLDAGEWAWIEISTADSGCHIITDKPALACSFLPSCNFRDPLRIRTGKGDPAMAWVSPLNRRVSSCIIKPFEIPGNPNEMIPQYHAMIVVPSAGKDSCSVCVNGGKNKALFGGEWYNHPSGWSYYDMLLDKDSTYLFSNSAFGLQAYSYGLAQTESYYMLASAKFRNWERSFTANDTHYLKLPELFFCEQEITFQAEVADSLSHQPGHICWYIDSVEEITARDQLVWKKHFTKGSYHIRMAVRYADEYDTATYSISSILHITRLEADVRTTPENCHHSDGSIILSVSSEDSASLTCMVDSTGGYRNPITGLKAGMYHITLQDRYCQWEQTVPIDSVAGPKADFDITDTIASEGMEIMFADKSLPGGAAINRWQWDMGDNTALSGNKVAHVYRLKNNYIIRLIVSDENHCLDTAEKMVRIVPAPCFPNAFAPDDGLQGNRFFRPMEECGRFHTFEMTIYNRWGNVVWRQCCNEGECPPYHDNSFWWDGKDMQGHPLSAGIYFYVVKATYSNSRLTPLYLNGSITLFR